MDSRITSALNSLASGLSNASTVVNTLLARQGEPSKMSDKDIQDAADTINAAANQLLALSATITPTSIEVTTSAPASPSST